MQYGGGNDPREKTLDGEGEELSIVIIPGEFEKYCSYKGPEIKDFFLYCFILYSVLILT